MAELSEQDYEGLKARMMIDVDRRLDELVIDMNSKGTEYSRCLSDRMEQIRKDVQREIGEVWSFTKSKLISIETWHNFFNNDIFPRLERKIGEAVKMAESASCNTIISRDAAKEAKKSVDQARIFLATTIITLAVALIGIVGTSVYKIVSDKQDQGAMILALQEKIHQDALNQLETVNYLKELEKALRDSALRRPNKY
jgi:hypothetical protein